GRCGQAHRPVRRRRRPALVFARRDRRRGRELARGRREGRGPLPFDRRRARRRADAAARPHPAVDAHDARILMAASDDEPREPRTPLTPSEPDEDAPRASSLFGQALGEAARRAGMDPSVEGSSTGAVVWKAIGGVRGIVESVLPLVVFLVSLTLWR